MVLAGMMITRLVRLAGSHGRQVFQQLIFFMVIEAIDEGMAVHSFDISNIIQLTMQEKFFSCFFPFNGLFIYICIDDLQQLFGNRCQQAVFHFFFGLILPDRKKYIVSTLA